MTKTFFISLYLFTLFISFSQIRIAESRHEFGNIFEEKGVVYADFKLTNPYFKDTIYIKNIETSCGCTAIVSNDTIIYPRTSINLKVSYDPLGRVGLFHKSVKIKTFTGATEHNEIYLKLTGNVVPKVKIIDVKPNLIEYKVAPIYFYPITEFDTSYLDFNFIIDFINDITYEVDYYQFSKVGFEISVRNSDKIEELEYLLRYSKYKFLREMKERGYGLARLFFTEPIFKLDNSLPPWAMGEIKVYSVSFNKDELSQSKIKLTKGKKVDNNVYLLNGKSSDPFKIDSVKNRINFNDLTSKLLVDSILHLNVDYKTPVSFGEKNVVKFEKELLKMIYKELKNLVGIDKNELVLHFDSIKTHVSANYYLRIWSANEMELNQEFNYQVKQDVIISPLLPTYKQNVFSLEDQIDTSSAQFKQFWRSLRSYVRTVDYIKLVLESSTSFYPKKIKTDPLYYARHRGIKFKKFIQEKFYSETGESINVEIKNILLGPKYSANEFSKNDYLQYEYVKLIPVYKNPRKLPIKPINVRPYIVNYDYYYVGVDTTSFVFKKFASYVIYEIQRHGFMELKTESSASNITVDRRKSNYYLAYSHLEESKNRFYDYLKKRLVDPNRLLITEERILVQGIPYSKNTPIIRYRRYQYVTFVPAKYLMNKK